MKYVTLCIGFFLFLVLTGSLTGCNETPPTTIAPVRTLTIGIQNSPSNSLVIIAARLNFFDTTKLKVVVREFSAGKLEPNDCARCIAALPCGAIWPK